jgi:hypothetical protein
MFKLGQSIFYSGEAYIISRRTGEWVRMVPLLGEGFLLIRINYLYEDLIKETYGR